MQPFHADVKKATISSSKINKPLKYHLQNPKALKCIKRYIRNYLSFNINLHAFLYRIKCNERIKTYESLEELKR